MAYEIRDNSGSLFVNTRKEKENHPDRTGKAMVGGIRYKVSGWIKKAEKGQWLSLSFTREEEQPNEIRPPMGNAPQRIVRNDPLDDEIPF